MTRFKRWLCCLLLLAFSLLSIRLMWIVSASQSGWTGYLHGWIGIAFASVGIERRPLREQDPPQQARYWLKQVARVNTSDDPALAVGVAWMLDEPQPDFRRHHRIDVSKISTVGNVNSDEATIESLEDEFEALCRDQCLQQAKLAVKLDPGNVELWRSLALLLVRNKSQSIDLTPRDSAWLEVLDECTLHDPENALYDYLAAILFWADSATDAWAGDGRELTIKDPVQFEAGNARLKLGLAKPYLRFGSHAYVATETFLKKTSILPSDEYEVTSSREVESRSACVLLRMQRWHSVFFDVAKKNGETEKVISTLRNSVRISDQVTKLDNYLRPFFITRILRRWALANLKDQAKAHSGIMTGLESQKLNLELNESRLESILLTKASENLRARPPVASQSFFDKLFLIVTFQMLSIITLGVGLLAGVLSHILGRLQLQDFVGLGWIRHVLAWMVGFAVSAFVLGICTSGISPHAGLSSTTSNDVPELLQQVFSSWSLVWPQWQAFLGPLASVAIATGVLSLWNFIRQARHFQRAERPEQTPLTSARIGSVCLVVRQSCSAASLLCFTIYLCLVPARFGQRSQNNEGRYQRPHDPVRAWVDMDREIVGIRSDEAAMEIVRAAIAKTARQDNEPSGQR